MNERLIPAGGRINNMKAEQQHLRGNFAQAVQQAGVDINARAQMNRRNEAIGHAVGSLGLLAEVLAEEIVVWRANVRQRIRLFQHFLGVQLSGIWERLLRVFANHSYKPIRLEGSAALGVGASEYQESKDILVSSYSFIDLAKILLTDDVEDGITRQFQLWSKPWACLPERKIVTDADEDGASEFQFFNRPLTFEDEDEILSLPSTQQTGTLRMQSIEAKMAKLSQQLSAILAAQAGTRSRVSSGANSQQKSPSAISIDDGVCMQSRSSRSRNESPVPSLPSITHKPLAKELPPVRPPPGPPPPPPPPPPLPQSSLTSQVAKQAPQPDVENLQSTSPVKSMCSTSIESLPSPRVQLLQDIKQFKFNKTVAKSPGGTPLVKTPLRENRQNIDSGGSVLAAIQYKFRNVRPSIDDEDETLTNNSFKDDEWADDNGDVKAKTQTEEESEMESQQ